MSLMIKMLEKSKQDGVGSNAMASDPVVRALEAREAKRSSWSAWAGWGVAAMVVLVAGPMIVERWYVKGEMTPVSALTGTTPVAQHSSQPLGTIHAVSEPPGAGVLLDGRFVGVTPIRFQWGSGSTTLTLKKNGFQDLIAPLQVEVAKEVDFRVTLQPETMPLVAAKPAENGINPVGATSASASLSAPAAPVSAPASVPVVASGSAPLSGAAPEKAATPPVAAAMPAPQAPTPAEPMAKPIEPASLAAIPAGEDPETDAPLQLAGVIRHPPEIRIAESPKSGGKEEGKAKKSVKSSKASKAHEGEVPMQDVREISKDPDLAPLLRQAEGTPSDTLNFAYSIQMSAFLDRESAIRNAALWRKRGYDAYVLELWGVKDPSRLWQSVRVGRFNDLVKARTALEALRRQEKIPGFYVARSDSFTPPEGAAPVQTAKIIPLTGPDSTVRVGPVGGKATGAGSESSATPPTTGGELPSGMPSEGSVHVPSDSQEKSREVAQAEVAPVDALPVTPVPLPVVSPTPRKSESKALAKAASKPLAQAELHAEPRPEPPAASKPLAQAELQAEPRPEPIAASKPLAQAELQAEPRPEPKAEPQSERRAGVHEAALKTPEPLHALSATGASGFEGGDSSASRKRNDPVGKGISAVAEESAAGDRVMDAKKVVALQPSMVGVQTAKDILPEPSAWSESEFRTQRQAEMKNSGHPPPDSLTPGAPQATDSKSPPEKRRSVTQSPEGARRDASVKVAADQAGWAERIYQQSTEKKDAGDREGEEALLQQVVKADPSHKGAVRRLARIMVESNRGDKALELLRQMAGGRGDQSLADDDPNLAAFLAALYQRREEHWQAIDLYDALLKKYPNKGLWQMGMAISLEKVEENNEALRAYKKALASGDLNHKLQSFVRKRIEKL
ncbi:MAG: PEGA domain-containing protein [Magnetococcales bacterium]|nr:PEGA domain-containing protein [Magnetococcales bacterium]